MLLGWLLTQFGIRQDKNDTSPFPSPLTHPLALFGSGSSVNVAVGLTLRDVSGWNRSLAPIYYRNAQAAIVTYDITSAPEASFEVRPLSTRLPARDRMS